MLTESSFESEKELEQWVLLHLQEFLGECVCLGGFVITTTSGKRGIPDAFAFNFEREEWFVIECELLRHGVWPHIAEQVTRFIVALENDDTRRVIRNQLFEHILRSGRQLEVSEQFGIPSERLLQELETFVEGIQPNVAIFIDDTDQDLTDFSQAINVPVEIYRIKKFLVDGRVECYSPDRTTPAITTLPTDRAAKGTQDYDVLGQLGGGQLLSTNSRVRCYRLQDGRVVHIRRSKYYPRNRSYWYGLNPNTIEVLQSVGVTHVVFVLGDWGLAVVPLKTVLDYCKITRATMNADGSVRHYHVLISQEPDAEMYWSKDTPRFDLRDTCIVFE